MLKGNDGTEFPVQLNCQCVITDDQISMLRITLTDITEIKMTQRALREAEAIAFAFAESKQIEKVQKEALNRLKKIASQLPGMVFQFRMYADGSSCFPYTSAAILDIYRLNPKEVREDASKIFALIHPDDYDGFIDSIWKSARNLSPWCYEYRVKFYDGTVRWLLGNARLQREEDDSTLWHGFVTDITELKQGQQILQDKEQMLSESQRIAHIGSWSIELETGYLSWSDEMFRIYGVAQEIFDHSVKAFVDLIHPDDRAAMKKWSNDCLAGKNPQELDFRILLPDGTVRFIRGNGELQYDKMKRPLRMLGSMQDISERVRQEQQKTQHLSDLAHVTRLGLMGEMASGIAHEVNQPLSAISTYTQVSLNLINTEHPDLVKLTEILSKTQQQASRAGRIIHRMREFIQSHTKQYSTTDINTLIHDCVDLCAAELKQNSIKLTFELENNLPPIHVDKIQIEQVIINLIRNSVDALRVIPEKQQRHIAIQSQLTLNDDIQVRVKDNGQGIDKDNQQKILTPFYTTKADGMGMGLSISRSLIEAHEGTLHFNSQTGKGTTFYFNLPLQRKSDEH